MTGDAPARPREGLAWSRDDYVLALELYQRRGRSSGANDPEVQDVAAIMGRSPASVSRRLGNYAGTESSGARGLKPVTGVGKEVWDELRNQPHLLTAEAEAARQRLSVQDASSVGPAVPAPERDPAAGSDVARQRIVEALRADLLGPTSKDEALRERPSTRYVCGILWPDGTEIDADQNEAPLSSSDEEDSSGFEVSVPLVQTLNPSAIGLSVVLHPGERTLAVDVEWGEYTRLSREEASQQDPHARGSVWQRTPVHAPTISIPLHAPGRSSGKHSVSEDGHVYVEWLIRPLADHPAVSVFLVNRRPKPTSGTERDERALFQPRITVRGVDSDASILGRLPHQEVEAASEADVRANQLLYREEQEFATGHGCAGAWQAAENSDRAARAWTDVLPVHEVPAMAPFEDIKGLEVNMGRLAEDVSADRLAEMLKPLVAEYDAWVTDLEAVLEHLDEGLLDQARQHVADCQEARARIDMGIRMLTENSEAYKAFRVMNEAMQLQRTHSDWARDFRQTGTRQASSPPVLGSWRPFQLAFILQCLPGIIDPQHRDRSIADLLWFPTGGGKTEAYLGLAAFVAVLRRLRHASEDHQGAGVCVLMRYTLRLVTVQQFQRAATLMCALEVLRQRDTSLGDVPFEVGLWVGRGTTPNRYEESEQALTTLAQDQDVAEGSPVQLMSCPWCGAPISARRNYRAIGARQRTLVECSRHECEFSFDHRDDGLPVLTVDQEIYRSVPCLLIATVDKFARLPWQAEAQAIFGRVSRQCPRHGYLAEGDDHQNSHRARGRYPAVSVRAVSPLPAPELVIQDELHLISGPLGSMMGLYEAGIDWLLSGPADEDDSRSPKILASTATIRRASDQVWNLFARQVRVFPPPGLTHRDSFFARQVPGDVAPGRLYVGVYAPGRSLKTAQVRVAALLLAAAQAELSVARSAADPYMTLVGYFNSLRELGGALNLFRDDVRGRLRVLAGRGFPARRLYEPRELTSRAPSREIPKTLDQLTLSHSDGQPDSVPVDVLLATNLISVGVDILRLGLMMVVGQPKATAEYIQATNRVGRAHPGLIVTLYNWTRPRDLSHYERFHAYHSALYRHVEATSVTPFAARARDRGIHGIYVGMCRVEDFSLNPEPGAGNFAREGPVPAHALEALVARALGLAGGVVAERVRSELLARQDRWEQLAAGGPLRYSWESRHQPAPSNVAVLLRWAGTEREGIWPTPGSLREVEAQAGLFLQEDFT